MTGSSERNTDNHLSDLRFATTHKQAETYRSHVDSDEEGDEENNLHDEDDHLDGKSSSIAFSSTLHHTAHKHHLTSVLSSTPIIDETKHNQSGVSHQRNATNIVPHGQGHGAHASAHGHHGHHHNHLSYNATVGLLMLIDGIGLAIITTATLLEAFDLWETIFDGYWGTNQVPSSLWLIGRTSQIIGLLFLIGKLRHMYLQRQHNMYTLTTNHLLI
ncbi:hypothetical protein EON65_01070 [archaeon]|nr:MAG: hypothetical protein EON65_01070 [archaeon]